MDSRMLYAAVVVLLVLEGRVVEGLTLTTLPTTIQVPENKRVGDIIFYCNYTPTNGAVVFNIAGNQQRRFSIDAQTGAIYLGGSLDYETTKNYTILPQVMNVNNPSDSDLEILTVNVTDINDNAPVCDPYTVLGQLDETALANTNFAKLSCTDKDTGDGGKVEYTVVSGNTSVIAVDVNSGQASIKYQINYDSEKKDSYSVTVNVTDKGDPKMFTLATVILSVKDADDNVPMFTQTVYTTNVTENEPVGTVVLTVSATDLDSPNTFNSLITYEVVACNPDWLMMDRYTVLKNPTTDIPKRKVQQRLGFFNLLTTVDVTSVLSVPYNTDDVNMTSTVGSMLVKDTVNYETSQWVNCTISAYSSNRASNKNLASVNIRVLDTNDRTPVFTQDLYIGNVTENTTALIGTPILRVNATDLDGGDDGRIVYYINDTDSIFTINSTTGEISLQHVPDYETKTSHLVTVTAEDQGSPKNNNTVFVQITINPVNEFPPMLNFTNCDFSVAEDVVPGDVVFNVSAFDLDAGLDGALTYSIDGLNKSSSFGVDAGTGIIRAIYPLDFEIPQSTIFAIIVKDNSTTSSKSASITCSVTVVNVNDSDVVCQHIPTVVLKNPTVNMNVAQLICNDSDNKGKALVNYGLCSGNLAGIFQVDSQGNVTLKELPNVNQYKLTVCVYDSVNQSMVTFTVLTETKMGFASLPRTVSVTEGDSGIQLINGSACCAFPKVEYSLIGVNEESKVTIDSATGVLTLTVPYDREVKDVYTYRVQATAESGQTIAENLTVIVTDINDIAPSFDSSIYVLKIDEGYTGNIVKQITATDRDLGINSTLNYTLINNPPEFGIDSSTGTLKLLNKLDYETQNNYTFEIVAADGGLPSLAGTATVYIIVQNKDEFSPEIVSIPSGFSQSLSEDVALGTTVIQLQGKDNDTGTTFVYSIVSGNLNNDFSIDPVSGNITTWKFLDRETTPSYSLEVKALNQNGQSATGTVTITVTDVNDNNPEFSQNVYIFTVKHNDSPGTFVSTLVVYDKDEGFNKTVNGKLSGSHYTDFKLTNFTLSNDATMDYISYNTYRLTVVASDTGTPSRSSSAVIVVNVLPSTTDVKFPKNQYTISLPENETLGTLVVDLNATEYGHKEDGSLKYSIVGAVPNNDFIVRERSGELIIAKSLDYERVPTSYTLLIEAFILPSGSPKATCTVTISILNLNDNAPVFKETSGYLQETFSFTVQEGTPVGTKVSNVKATDDDSPPYGNITYSLSNTTKFRIDPTTGDISVNGNLSYLDASFYNLIITANDSGDPSLTAQISLVIIIVDINDHSPVFITPDSVSVLDITPVGSEIFRFHASDLDTGAAGDVSYLDAFSQLDHFELDGVTGVLKTKFALVATTNRTYSVTIRATDKGSAVRTTDQAFTINVISTDPNKHDPNITGPYTATVQRTASSGSPVETVIATDEDRGLSGTVTYTIVSGNTDGYFIINDVKGTITTATSVLTASDAYTLTVVATDSGVPSRSANTTVTINVLPPKTTFASANYIFNVNESASNKEVGRIAVDNNRVPSGYSIISGNIGPAFDISRDINTNEGILKVIKVDYETLPVYSLQVDVSTDIGSYTKIVEVRVLDENDNAPNFTATTITLTIPENLPVGHLVDTITATDADVTLAFKTITYGFPGKGKGYFDYDSSTGQLTVKVSPDFEAGATDTVVLSATDLLYTSSVTVNINLIDIDETEDVSTSSLTSNALISLEVPYQAATGHSIVTLSAGDFGINISSTANVEFIAYKSDIPFTIDRYTGRLTVSGSTALQNHAKYFMWVLCRTVDGSVTTSQISLIRVDTFDLYSEMAVIEFAESYPEVLSKKEAFQRRGQTYFTDPGQRFRISNLIDTSSTSRRRLLATNTIAYTYVVSNTKTTDNMANVNQDKTFLTDTQILQKLQKSSDGTPVSGLSDPNFLEVSKVEPYQETQESSASDFVSSPAGIAMFCLLGLLLLLALIVLIACLCYRKKKRDDERKLFEERDKKSKSKDRAGDFMVVREHSDSDFHPKRYDSAPPPAMLSYRQITPPVNYTQPSPTEVLLLNVPEEKHDMSTAAPAKPKESTKSSTPPAAATQEGDGQPTAQNEVTKPTEEKKRIVTQRGETNNNVSIIKSSAKTFSGTSLAASTIPLKPKGKANAGRKLSPNRRAKNFQMSPKKEETAVKESSPKSDQTTEAQDSSTSDLTSRTQSASASPQEDPEGASPAEPANEK